MNCKECGQSLTKSSHELKMITLDPIYICKNSECPDYFLRKKAPMRWAGCSYRELAQVSGKCEQVIRCYVRFLLQKLPAEDFIR